ncbi:MAG: M48 family metalloprotease [Desulfovibrionales bacterium]
MRQKAMFTGCLRRHSTTAGWLNFDRSNLLALVLTALFLAGCQTIEATGQRRLTLISESQEITMGTQANEQILESMSLYPDEDLQTYVNELGLRIAATTERPELPWSFRILDDDVVNAFALPGGYIYVTRGIMAHFENEAQLAGVLGHEIGHVTGRHSVIRMSKSVLAQLGLGAAQILVPEVGGLTQAAGAGLQLLFLKFSRDDEIESDLLGVRYMQNIREDPRELIDVMEMLARVSETEQRGALPQWAMTHPLPENRREIIAEQLRSTDPVQYQPVNREGYLRRLEGMTYGKDPREGIIRENVFYHPDMRFQYDFPNTWQIVNQKKAVLGISQAKDAVIQISLSDRESAVAALQTMFRQEGIAGKGAERTRINGLPAATGTFLARTPQGVIEGRATYIEYGERLFQIIGYSGQQTWQKYDRIVAPSMFSFQELTDPKFLEVDPLRINIVTVERRTTLRQFHGRRNVPIPVDEFARLNQAEIDETLEPGRLLKLVVGTAP